MKIEGIGNYQGTITKTFKIAPKKASLKKVKSGKKTATLYIIKNGGGVTGYQIRLTLYKKNFKSSKYKVSKKTTYKRKIERIETQKTSICEDSSLQTGWKSKNLWKLEQLQKGKN